MTFLVNFPRNDLDVPNVGAVFPGEVSDLGHAEGHGPDAQVELLPVQGREQEVQILVKLSVSNSRKLEYKVR